MESLGSDTFYGDFMVKLIWKLSQDSVESDTFYEDLMLKLVWRLSAC